MDGARPAVGLGLAISGSTQSRTLGRLGDQSGCLGMLHLSNRVSHLISCLFALERSRGPGSQQVNVPKRNSIMHSPGVPFRRSVLHCRGEQAIAHQDSGRSDMHFSPLPSRLNGLTLSIGGHLCWKRMRQRQTQIVHTVSKQSQRMGPDQSINVEQKVGGQP